MYIICFIYISLLYAIYRTCIIIYLSLSFLMYIKTYSQDPEEQDQVDKKSGKNLATSTPEGINLHRMMYKRSLSKTQKLQNKNQGQLIDNIITDNKHHKSASQNHIIPPNIDTQIPKFYQSSYFGICLRNNRLREVKQKYKSKGKQKINEKVKEQLINIITKNGFKLSHHKNNIKNKIRSYTTSVNPQNRQKQIIQFSVSGRPVSRDFRGPLQKKITPEIISIQKLKANKAVLDLSKINKFLFEQKIDIKNSVPKNNLKSTIVRQFTNDINVNSKSSRIHDYLQIYEQVIPKHAEQSPKTYEMLERQVRTQTKKQRKLNESDAAQPQILIDYRRSMSSGRKRIKFYGKTDYTSDDNLRRSKEGNFNNENGVHDQKRMNKIQRGIIVDNINPWAVKRLEQQQQFLF